MISIQQQNDRFNYYCALAFAVHLGLVLLVLLINEIAGLNLFKSKNIDTEIIQSSVRVDIVAMPKFTVQELKKMKVSPAPTDPESVESLAKEEVKEPEPESKVDLSNILNTISKKEIKAKPAKKVKGAKVDKTRLKKLILEGNKLSKGATAVGDAYANQQTQFNTYIATVPEYIRPYWKLPSYLLERNDLNCRIKIYIDDNGRIMRTEMISSSGVPEYDQKALLAIKEAGSLPPPPKEILSKVVSGKVVLGFPL